MADYYGKIGGNRIVRIPAVAEKASGSHLTSKSIRDCRLSARSSVKIRVKAPVGVTGGAVEASAYQREYETAIKNTKRVITTTKRTRIAVARRNNVKTRTNELRAITQN